MSKYIVGIVGATGIVGRELLLALEERNFPVNSLRLFASERSKGKSIEFKGASTRVECINRDSLYECDFIFGCSSNKVSKETAALLNGGKGIFIDNSSAFRYESNIPLVVPEINGNLITSDTKIVANPNCTAIILTMAVWPIHREFIIKRMLVSTYQAVSGAGLAAMQELEQQVIQYSKNEPLTRNIFPEQILFNIQSHNTPIAENGFNGEENKVITETRKILSAPNLPVSVTCMRVPVLRAHVESINIDLERKCDEDRITRVLKEAPGIKVVDDRLNNSFPTALKASNQDLVLVGRVRRDISTSSGFHLLIAGDQIRKGAAVNALQIAEFIVKKA